ncbi:protein serine/threonine phosphatase 2C, partial [Schizopora paradoxa]
MTTTNNTAATATTTTTSDGGHSGDPGGVYDETDLGHPGYSFRYRLLAEPHLTRELTRQALAKRYQLGDATGTSKGGDSTSRGAAYSVSLQPCCEPDALSQDRLSVESWTINNESWTFAGVFDGHGGHEAADYTVQALPSQIRSALSSYLSSSSTGAHASSSSAVEPEAISKLLASTITAFDERIGQALLALFPRGEAQVATMSDEEIDELMNDQEKGGTNAAILSHCMRGTTALVALVDPARENLWVVNLGDCIAVLGEAGEKSNPETPARSIVLNALHNGGNPTEFERIEREHPGEPECMLRKRVLGALAVTRAIGDHTFKLPAVYTDRIFLNARVRFKTMTPMHEVVPRIRTPPYVSNTPEVKHVALGTAFNGGSLSTAEMDAVRKVIQGKKSGEGKVEEGKALPDEADPPPPTPLRDDGDVVEQGDGFDVEVVPPTPKVPGAVPSRFDDSDSDDGSDVSTASEGDDNAGFRHAVSEQLARNTEYGSMVTDGAANRALQHSKDCQRFLILASDGLQFLYDDEVKAEKWADVVGQALVANDGGDGMDNPALSLLRDGLGGTDPKRVSSMLTVELGDRWMDDTTIVVLPL